MLLRWLFFLSFFGLLQWYSFQVIKTIGLSKPWIITYMVLVGLILAILCTSVLGMIDLLVGPRDQFSLGLF